MPPPLQPPLQQLQQGAQRVADEEQLCVVCMEEQRSEVLVPCGHVVLCQECCAAVQDAKNEVRRGKRSCAGLASGGKGLGAELWFLLQKVAGAGHLPYPSPE